MDRAQAAYHEAGHVVAAWSNGWTVQSVTVTQDGKGQTHYLCPSMADPAAEALVCCAGSVAENLAGGMGGHPSFTDVLGVIESIGQRRPGGDVMEALQEDGRRVVDLLRQHWPAVEAVAVALLEWETLTEDDLRQILGAVYRCQNAH